MKNLLIACTIAAMLVAAAGCGASKSVAGPAAFLADGNSKVVFIQWRPESDGRLQGAITEDSLGGSGSAQTLSATSVPFIGAVSGNSVLLTFASMYFLHAHAHGTLSGSVLTMVLPQSDGTITQIRLSRSDNASYDRSVSELRGRIRQANLVAANQQAGQRQHPMRAVAEKSTQSTLVALYKDSSLAPGGILATGMTRFQHHIEAAQSRLAIEKRDAFGDDKYCAAADTATGDAKGVDGALQAVQGDILAVMPDISAARHYAASATAQLRHLNRQGLPVPDQASTVIANARVSLKNAIAAANSYINQTNVIYAQSRSVANNLATGKCSSAQSGVVMHPIPPIK
jgi:hypothetical protein